MADIESYSKKIGAPPSGVKPDGSPHYTLPTIYDPSTKSLITESLLIAEYLDKTYPDKPRIIPDGTHSLQRAFRAAFEPFEAALRPFVIPVIHEQFEGESKTFYRTVLEEIFQTKISEMKPKGEEGKQAWKKLEDFYDTFAAWYVEEGNGPYVMGASPCFADLILTSRIWWIMKVFGSDSPQWQDARSWSGGKWERMLLQFQHDYD
ncbi:hypothetical protein NLJ89_g583 [Agrocybe chaxingu]|uniref:GST N-terminal domain-containing protein n=1 Tax=Agrocybe chaxingu TaxID=84603 RepID=A0A9W8N1R3_9AGAR|nr:hypothetical protein NLJ89_g583 [Agrocybe chaxingu]